MKDISRLIRFIGFALLIAAVVQELRKPSSERTWRGRVAGFIPYDLRLPTPGRFLATVWNPNNQNLLVGTPFGVGWTVNLRALSNFLRPATGGM